MSEVINISSVVKDFAEANEDTGQVAIVVLISHKPTETWSAKFKEEVDGIGIDARITNYNVENAIWLHAAPGKIQDAYDQLKETVARVNTHLEEEAERRDKENHKRLLKKREIEGLALNELQRLKD